MSFSEIVALGALGFAGLMGIRLWWVNRALRQERFESLQRGAEEALGKIKDENSKFQEEVDHAAEEHRQADKALNDSLSRRSSSDSPSAGGVKGSTREWRPGNGD